MSIPQNSGFDPEVIKGVGGILVHGGGEVTIDGNGLAGAVGTIAELAALPTGNQTRYVWVAEVDAFYQFVPGSAATSDGWTVVAKTGPGVAGQWILVGEQLSLAPLG